MEIDFKNAWYAHFAPKRATMHKEQADAHERFALGNRKRADDFIEYIRAKLHYDFSGKKVLDVGSAYGGFVIRSAQAGAMATGIEIEKRLHDFALQNAHGEHGDFRFYLGNILERNDLPVLNQKFDLIIINDVFEHIFDTAHLFARLQELSADQAIIYFSVPNGQSYHALEKEGHFFKTGLTLLEPSEWSTAVGAFNVYYHPLRFYQNHFVDSGFPFIYLSVEEKKIPLAPAVIRRRIQEIEPKILAGPFAQPGLNEKAKYRFHLLKQQIEDDYGKLTPLELHLKYEQYFWTGFAMREEAPHLQEAREFVCLNSSQRLQQPVHIEKRLTWDSFETGNSYIDAANFTVETNNGDSESAKVPIGQGMGTQKFGLRLPNENNPACGDQASAQLSLPLDQEQDYVLSLIITNPYENEKLTGRIEWIFEVNDKIIEREDISLSGRPKPTTILIQKGKESINIKLIIRALMDCEPWHWGSASTTYLENLVLQPIRESV